MLERFYHIEALSTLPPSGLQEKNTHRFIRLLFTPHSLGSTGADETDQDERQVSDQTS